MIAPNLQIFGTLKGEEEERSDSGWSENTRDRVNTRDVGDCHAVINRNLSKQCP